MEKKYVVRYQGGSGGFLVAWLLQMTVQSDCFDSALQCFHHSLKNNSIEWKNYEITPPDVALICNVLAPDYAIANYDHEKIISFAVADLEKIINNNTRIDSDWTLQKALKAYLNNEIYKKMHSEFDDKIDNLSVNAKLLEEVKSYVKLLYTNSKNLLITAPVEFIKIANNTKAGVFNGKIDYSGVANPKSDSNIIHHSAIFNKYKDKLNLFPIESVWRGDWQDYIEKFIGKKLTPHQRHRCLTIISRWLEIQPTEIKKYINL